MLQFNWIVISFQSNFEYIKLDMKLFDSVNRVSLSFVTPSTTKNHSPRDKNNYLPNAVLELTTVQLFENREKKKHIF